MCANPEAAHASLQMLDCEAFAAQEDMVPPLSRAGVEANYSLSTPARSPHMTLHSKNLALSATSQITSSLTNVLLF